MEKIDIKELAKQIRSICLNKEIYINLSGMINAKIIIRNAELKYEREKIIIKNRGEQDIELEKRFIKNIFTDKEFNKIKIELDCYQTILITIK